MASISIRSMRKLCPNLDRQDGLDTVLEVPVPDETFVATGNALKGGKLRCRARCVKGWMRSRMDRRAPSSRSRGAELQVMLGVIGAPLVPQPVEARKSMRSRDIKEGPIETSMAKYIVEQYIAAAGGDTVLSGVTSMYAMGNVRMKASDLRAGHDTNGGKKKVERGGPGEVGGFVVWQKRPDLWCLELVVSGCKISAGSDGKVAWRQTPWQQAHASRGPPRPLRRCIQGLDPKSTANLFADAIWVGEKAIGDDDCFVLRADAGRGALRSRSSASVEVVRHAVWGYFSQRTGLLVHLEDSYLLRIRGENNESVYWETTTESSIGDYRAVDGINIAHAGHSVVSLFRFGQKDDDRERTCTHMEETWTIEEVDFNIVGLSTDCFLPPRDLKEEEDKKTEAVSRDVAVKSGGMRPSAVRVPAVATWFGPAKVAAVDTDESDCTAQEDSQKW